MKWDLIQTEGHGRLILIFAGWGTDASFYSHIRIKGWDTMVVWDYSSLNFPTEIFDAYHTVALFAWSLGVYAASKTIPFGRITLVVAINGTERPVDDRLGIPVNIFNGTAENLDTRNLLKFRKRMAGTKFKEIDIRFSRNNIDELKKELLTIGKESSLQNTPEEKTKWNRIFISTGDRIFPAGSQQRAWSEHPSHPEITMIDGEHYVDLFDIIKSMLPSKEKIGERFRQALATYDSNASAQRQIADRLVAFTVSHTERRSLSKVIEIGSGSGLFTLSFSKIFSPVHSIYVDLYPLPQYEAASEEDFIVADAEDWAEEEAKRNPGKYDAIVSASAMQWFANPERFIYNATKLLKPDGLMALSTFLPGNLSELKSINPYGLPYRDREEIKEMAKRHFRYTSFEDETIKVNFSHPREVLRHLRQTGVGGSSTSSLTLRQIMERLPSSLTYRPLYIFATGKWNN